MSHGSSASRPLRWAILAITILSVAAGGLNGSGRWGQSPAEFAADSDRLLRVAGYAFSIWGPIYVGLLAYALRQAFARGFTSAFAERLALPSLLSIAGIGLWIVAAGLDAELWTIVLIVGSAVCLIWPLLAHAGCARALPARSVERALVLWPLAALAGWLTVASPVNLLTVAAGNRALPPGAPEWIWPLAAVVAVAALALGVTGRLRSLSYALPIAWGLAGVAVAERARGGDALAWTAGAAAALVVGGAAALTWGRGRRA